MFLTNFWTKFNFFPIFSGFATLSHYHTGLRNPGTPVPSMDHFFLLGNASRPVWEVHTHDPGHEQRRGGEFKPPELIICCGNCRPQSLMKLFHFPGPASVIFSAGATLESQDFKQWKDGSVYNHKEGLGLVWSRLIKAEYKGGYLNFYWLLELIGV